LEEKDGRLLVQSEEAVRLPEWLRLDTACG